MTKSPMRQRAPVWVAGILLGLVVGWLTIGGAAGVAMGVGLGLALGVAFSRVGRGSDRS
ncbi:hypothetical protein [Micromonospora sp. NPDC005806]|uniref:hypothetical protein n=1 Tax=Micromonospora sp. NPDC005806 TaxID=3364234 RepID=UPI0036D189C2